MTDDIFSLANLRDIEKAADQAGLDLMQKAADSVTHWVVQHYPKDCTILVAAGTGNNGGDALWVAYKLAQLTYPITLFVPETPKQGNIQKVLHACLAQGILLIKDLSDLNTSFSLLIDGLFGIGLNRMLSSTWQAIVQQINSLDIPILSLDVPSGLDAWCGRIYGEAIQANTTLTFLCAKPGLYTAEGPDHAGQVIVDTLDLPATMRPIPCGTLSTPLAHSLARKMNSHKGQYGTVCVVGGAMGMVGAALLAGRAAISTGAGKVYVGLIEPILYDAAMPDLMIKDAKAIHTLDANVYVLGPGLSCTNRAYQILQPLLDKQGKKVIDADALNLIAQHDELAKAISAKPDTCILTPHPIEAARLLNITVDEVQNDRVAASKMLAQKFCTTVVLKGCGTIVARRDGFFRVNISGNAALSVAGQGDVLSGLCGALFAQDMPIFEAASLGVYVHGLAANQWQNMHQGVIGLTASQTISLMAKELNRLIAKSLSMSRKQRHFL
jgi:hydroxyethylthiazole kinase-like uncharacterized protein yjeF